MFRVPRKRGVVQQPREGIQVVVFFVVVAVLSVVVVVVEVVR